MTAGTVWTEISRLEKRIDSIVDMLEEIVNSIGDLTTHLKAMDSRICTMEAKKRAKTDKGEN